MTLLSFNNKSNSFSSLIKMLSNLFFALSAFFKISSYIELAFLFSKLRASPIYVCSVLSSKLIVSSISPISIGNLLDARVSPFLSFPNLILLLISSNFNLVLLSKLEYVFLFLPKLIAICREL